VAKQMVFEDEARQPLAVGVSKLARAVVSTLGPRGRNAVLDKGWGLQNSNTSLATTLPSLWRTGNTAGITTAAILAIHRITNQNLL